MLTGVGSSTVERAGDVFSVPYAAVWEDRYGTYWITVVLAADDRNPFDVRDREFSDQLVLTFDDGTYYDRTMVMNRTTREMWSGDPLMESCGEENTVPIPSVPSITSESTHGAT